MVNVSFSDARMTISGIEIPLVDIELSFKDAPRREPILGKFSGSVSATMEMSPDFLRALDGACPQPLYRGVGSVLLVASPYPMEVCPVGWAQPLRGLLWSDIGVTRGPEGTNRLRKFIRRDGRLAEVRTRGRSGLRSLAEAVEAAGVEGLVPRTMTIEGPVPNVVAR